MEVLEGAHVLLSRPMGRYDSVLVGPSPEAEVLTDRVPRMIPMIRSSPGGKGWELVFPRTLDGHVSAAGRTRTLVECAADASARADGDLAVFPLPKGCAGGIELGPLFVRFREVPDSTAGTPVQPPAGDETGPTAIGIGAVALLLVLLALRLGPEVAATRDPLLAAATPTPHGGGTDATPTGGAETPLPVESVAPSATGIASASPAPTGSALTGASPLPAGSARPTPGATALAAASPAPTATPRTGASPAPTATARAGASPAPIGTARPGATPSATAAAVQGATARPSGTPRPSPTERDPLALGVTSPRIAKSTATPARTPPPSGFLGTNDLLEDEGSFNARLDAVPEIKSAKAGGPEGPLPGDLGAGAGAAMAALVRDGGHGEVGPVDVSAAGSGDVRVASAGKVETPVEGRMDAGAPRVTGTIDPARVQAVVQDAAPTLRKCYEAALKSDARLAGRVTLTWTIVEDGAVEEIAVGSSTLKNEEVERCLMTRVRRLRFPRPDGGTVRVEFPLVFQPAIDPS